MKKPWYIRVARVLIGLIVFVLLVIWIDPRIFLARTLISTRLALLKSEPEPVAQIDDYELEINSGVIKARVYYPGTEDNYPVIFYVHGGGFIIGSLKTHDNITRYMANHLNAAVFTVEYRKSPKHRFPVALRDLRFSLQWMQDHAQELRLDPSRLVLMGDSAGGNLVPALLIDAAERGELLHPLATALINPILDLQKSAAGYRDYSFFINAYIDWVADALDPRASPLLWQDYSIYPPSFIIVSELDPIRVEGVAFHENLQRAGIETAIYEFKEFGHLGELWAGAHDDTLPGREFLVAHLAALLLAR